jgi:hypothetical protein
MTRWKTTVTIFNPEGKTMTENNRDEQPADPMLFAAFLRAQRKFGKALKTSDNPHFKSRYADLAECVEAVIDALHSEGFAFTQFTERDDKGAFVRTVLLHESGELLTLGEFWVPSPKHDPQGFGSALTYARRYSLMSAMGMAPQDDDGSIASKPKAYAVDETVMADLLSSIGASSDEKSLLKAYTDAFKATKGDANAQKRIIAAKDAKKTELGVSK